jgi:hypothetical protein
MAITNRQAQMNKKKTTGGMMAKLFLPFLFIFLNFLYQKKDICTDKQVPVQYKKNNKH